MKIVELEYGKVLNDGNYGNDRLTIKAQLDDHEAEDVVACIAHLSALVQSQLKSIQKAERVRPLSGYRDDDDDEDEAGR